MSPEEAKAHQEQLIADGWNIGFWYGTGCKKCCGVYPKFIIQIWPKDLCRYECEVCGKTTEPYRMIWEAEEAWNKGLFIK
jgi:hypothetical protein